MSRLVAYLGLGIVAGISYGYVDRGLDERLINGTLTGVLTRVHATFGYALPILTGVLLGLVTFAWRERTRAADQELHRAQSLETRLAHVERDQAVWVMAASVLHEVRNPLHALGLLLDDLEASLATKEGAAAAIVERCRSHMDRIAAQTNLLRTLREVATPRRERTDLRSIVESVVAGRARDLGVVGARPIIHATQPVVAEGDRTYIRIILENLLDNSLHALGGAASTRSVTVDVERSGERALVRVGDSGCGVEKSDEEALFTPFRSTKTRGLGLGLPIARALARAMHGDLVFEGTSRGETHFALWLPAGEGS